MSMTKQEYEESCRLIQGIRLALDNQYISENTTIAPGSIVMAVGQKCYLKKYKIVGGNIYPILHKLRKDGSYYQNERINVSKGVKLIKA